MQEDADQLFLPLLPLLPLLSYLTQSEQCGSPSYTDIAWVAEQISDLALDRSAVDPGSNVVDRFDLPASSFGKRGEGQGFDLPSKSLTSNPPGISPTPLNLILDDELRDAVVGNTQLNLSGSDLVDLLQPRYYSSAWNYSLLEG